ncbi:hypothetical protein FSP39_007790 [Pinctada imbricata]|uniref:Uncharacterized protein n=1 Tax=Pinctada imbricata TaxID=66713 RepID=A0AA89C0U4_PINIB|nr:hypothetical protein FSP39_007790 [Pinctada imbricata]
MASPHSDSESPLHENTELPQFPARIMESQSETIRKLREEGIVPTSIHKKGLCFYVTMDDHSGNQIVITAKKRKLKTMKIKKRQKVDAEDRLTKANELHKEMLHQKGESWRTYTDRFKKMKELQERKAEELRQKIEKKMQEAKDRLKEKGSQVCKDGIDKKLQEARERRDAIDKEFRERSERKLLQEAERMTNKLQDNKKSPCVDDKINSALYRREKYLKERQNIYLQKMKNMEDNRKRREEFLKMRTSSPRQRRNGPY